MGRINGDCGIAVDHRAVCPRGKDRRRIGTAASPGTATAAQEQQQGDQATYIEAFFLLWPLYRYRPNL